MGLVHLSTLYYSFNQPSTLKMNNFATNMNSNTELSEHDADQLGLTKTEDGNYGVPPRLPEGLPDLGDLGQSHTAITIESPGSGNSESEDQGAPDSESPNSESSDDDSGDSSAADVLLQLAEKATFFHTPKDEAFATYPRGKGWDTSRVQSESFEDWLRHEYYKLTKGAPPSQALADAKDTLEAKGKFDGSQREVNLRVGAHPNEDTDRIYVDLCNEDREVLELSKDRLETITDPPVQFRRVQNTGALPAPEPSKDGLERLRKYTSVDDDHFALLLAFMVQCFNPRSPYPLLFLHGEQGSGKSTLTRMITEIVDPSTLDTRSLPSGERDLVIAAENARVLAFDNSSNLSSNLSDVLCRLSTGSGFTTRTLYSDRGEEIFESARPVIINGIEQVAERSDLMDRSLFVELQSIPENERRTEQDLWKEFREDQPHILGGLVWAVSAALKRQDQVQLDTMPRMADFAQWAVAAEPALPVEEGAIMRALKLNQEEAARTILNDNPLAVAIMDLLEDSKDQTWVGTTEELRQEAQDYWPELKDTSQEYPSSVQKMTPKLKRIEPALRTAGVTQSDDVSRGSHRAFRLSL